MSKEKITTIRIKEVNKQMLDDQIEDMKYRIKNGFNISSLVKNKRGIDYEEQIVYLVKFYSRCIKMFRRLSSKEKKLSIIGKVLKELS